MFRKKKLIFKIENGHLTIGDDIIYLNWVNNIGIRESAMREGEYAIHVENDGYFSSVIELYFTGSGDDVYEAYEELCYAIKKVCPEFHSCFQTEFINLRNVQYISYVPGLLQNSKVKISFKRDEKDLVRAASKVEYEKLKNTFEEYKESKCKDNIVL